MKLDRIEVKGFKSIRAMNELVLHLLNVLIGANGAGKTNFITLFKLLNQIVEGNLQSFVGQAGGANALVHFGQKVTSELTAKLQFGPNGYEVRLGASVDDTLFFQEETCWYHGQGYLSPYYIPIGSGHKESRLEAESRTQKVAKYVLEGLKSWRVYHFHDTSDSAKVKLTGDIDDNAVLRPDAANLAAFLYWLREEHASYYDNIVKTIRLAAPFFEDCDLRPAPRNHNKIKLEWRERGSDTYFDASALSDGTLRFICLTTLLMQPSLPSTILIDEPELGLHPYALTLLAAMLRSAATKTQVIVSTQSAQLVNQFAPEDIIVVDREDGQSVFRRLNIQDLESWLEEYALGELWEKNIIGGRP